jgi:hypothetical protein
MRDVSVPYISRIDTTNRVGGGVGGGVGDSRNRVTIEIRVELERLVI